MSDIESVKTSLYERSKNNLILIAAKYGMKVPNVMNFVDTQILSNPRFIPDINTIRGLRKAATNKQSE